MLETEKELKAKFKREKEYADYHDKIFPNKKIPKNIEEELDSSSQWYKNNNNLKFGDHILFPNILFRKRYSYDELS